MRRRGTTWTALCLALAGCTLQSEAPLGGNPMPANDETRAAPAQATLPAKPKQVATATFGLG